VSGTVSDDLLTLLRHRIATHFYDDVRIIDEIARALVRLPLQLM
jgi:hypothetical protein